MQCHECILTYRSVEKSLRQWARFAERNTFFSLAFLLNVETIFRDYTVYEAASQVYLKKKDGYAK